MNISDFLLYFQYFIAAALAAYLVYVAWEYRFKRPILLFLQQWSKKTIDDMDNDTNVESIRSTQSEFWNGTLIVATSMIIFLTILLAFLWAEPTFGGRINYDKDPFSKNALTDIRNIIVAVITGLVFSFILSIKAIREHLLKVISSFMSDFSYLSKLKSDELIRVRHAAAEIMHGIDITSNGESLYNFIEKYDKFLSEPHQSITNQTFIFKNFDSREDLFVVSREDSYRIHTLKLDQHKVFPIRQYSVTTIKSADIGTFLRNYRLELDIGEAIKVRVALKGEINDESIFTELISDNYKEIDNLFSIECPSNIRLEFKVRYSEEDGVFKMDFKAMVPLEHEFTRVNMRTTRIVNIDYFFCVRIFYPTYGHRITMHYPEGYRIKEIVHHQNLNIIEKQTIIQNNGDNASIDTNGWQLPGMVFALSYEKSIFQEGSNV